MKLFIGEVGAGNEAKSQAWARRRKATTPTQGTGPLWLVAWVWAGGWTQMRGSRASSVSVSTQHAQTGTHTHACTHAHICTHVHVHARTHLIHTWGSPQPSRPCSFPPSHLHHLLSDLPAGGIWRNLETNTYRDPFLSSCALTGAHRSSTSPGTNATNQVACSAAPRPPGSCAHHWTAHSLGSGTVPAAPPGPDPGPPGPCPTVVRLRETLPLAEQPQLAAAEKLLVFHKPSRTGQVSGPSLCIYRAACLRLGGLGSIWSLDGGHHRHAAPRPCQAKEAYPGSRVGPGRQTRHEETGASGGEGLRSQGRWHLGDQL